MLSLSPVLLCLLVVSCDVTAELIYIRYSSAWAST